MISVHEREKARRAYFVEGKSRRQIARELGHARRTVKAAIGLAEASECRMQKEREAPVLGLYKARIEELIQAQHEHRLPKFLDCAFR